MNETNGPLEPIANGDGRAADGRFQPGHVLTRGKPRNTRMAELRRAVLDAQTPERVKGVVDKLHELAVAGDSTAARVYLDTIIGKAPTAVELSGPDGEALGVDLVRVEAALLAVVEPYGPGAQFKLAAALRGLAIDAGRDAG